MKHPRYNSKSYQIEEGDKTPYTILNYIALLSYSPSLYEEIDEQYKKDSKKYYISAKTSEYYNYMYFKSTTIEREMYCKKLLGIVRIGLETTPELIDWIVELGRKPYIRAYQLIEKCTIIGDAEWSILLNIFSEREKRLNNNHFENTMLYEAESLFRDSSKTGEFYHSIFQQMIIANFLSIVYSKEILLTTDFNKLFIGAMEKKTKYDTAKLEYLTFEDTETQRKKEEALAIKKLILNPSLHKTADFFEKDEDGDYDELSHEEIDTMTIYFLFQHYKERYELQFESVCKSNSKKELEKKITELALLSPYRRPKDYLKAVHFIYIGLIIDSLLQTFRKNREYFLENNSEYIEGKRIQEEGKTQALEDEVAELKEKLRKQSEELSLKNKIIKDFQKEKESSEYKHGQVVKKLEKEVKKYEKGKEELVFLKEFYHSFQQEEKERHENRVVEEKDIALINNKQLLIVGGKENWKTTLSQRVSVDFLYYEQSNFDRKIISKYDYVFFNTNYMNHGMFYKVMNELKKQNVPFGFLNRTNVEYNILEMIDYLTK